MKTPQFTAGSSRVLNLPGIGQATLINGPVDAALSYIDAVIENKQQMVFAGLSTNLDEPHMDILVISDDIDTDKLTELKAINKVLIQSLLQDNYVYLKMMSALDNDINQVTGENGFYGIPTGTGKTFVQNFFATMFGEDRKIKGSNETVLLFIGRQNTTRTRAAWINGQPETFKTLPDTFESMPVIDFVSGRSTLGVMTYGHKQVAALKTEWIRQFLTDPSYKLTWSETVLDYTVEEISLGIDGSDTVILTVGGSDTYRYIPATLVWDGDKLKFVTNLTIAVRLTDIPLTDVGGIVRASVRDNVVVMVDRNGGTNIVRYSNVTQMGQRFTDMITAASEMQVAS